MREILFRAKSYDGYWKYGQINTNIHVLYEYSKDRFEGDLNLKNHNIWIETIGQYIGRKDKFETNIFEGDIVKDSNGEIWTVSYSEERAMFKLVNKSNGIMDFLDIILLGSEIEIIGNIYDNPELLKGE